MRDLEPPKSAQVEKGRVPKVPFSFTHRFATAGSHLVTLILEPDPPVEERPADYVVKDHVPGDNRQDCGKGDRGDEAEERRAAHDFCKERRRHVPPGIDRANLILSDEHHRAKSKHESQQIEQPDETRSVGNRLARGLGVGHGVKAHQDVRQTGRAQHQRQAERNGVPRIGHEPAGREHAGAVAFGGGGKQRQRIETELDQHQRRQRKRPRQQQNRLDDLHPRRRNHAAEQHVSEHDHTNDDNG